MYFQPSEYNHIHGLFKAETNTKNNKKKQKTKTIKKQTPPQKKQNKMQCIKIPMFLPVPSEDVDFQQHMSLFSLYLKFSE